MLDPESVKLASQGARRSIAMELLVLSMVSLFLELLVIRWLSSDVRAFTVFRTFPLVTCFVGLGAGFALGSDRAFRLTLYALLQLVITMRLAELLGVTLWGFPATSVFQWGNLAVNSLAPAYMLVFMPLLILLLAGPFAVCLCIGARLGVLFNQLEPLKAYLINLAGALLGSLVFAALSYIGLAPEWLLLSAAVAVAGYLIVRHGQRWRHLTAIALLALLAAWTPHATTLPLVGELLAYRSVGPITFWSPYQRLDLTVFRLPDSAESADSFLGAELAVNRAFYQYFFSDKAGSHVSGDIARFLAARKRQYSLPFELKPADDVLIVGAGLGQNAEAALGHGVKSVDAVDIDPQILKLGRQYNPAYRSAVNLICDDARHFFGRTEKRYDLIVFGLLDSHAVIGQGSSVRIDTYIYTTEGIREALSLLKPGGLAVISFAAVAPWIKDRLWRTMEQACGYRPLVLRDSRAFVWGKPDIIFILGDGVRQGQISPPPGWERVAAPGPARVRILTDDWPYLYVQPDILDIPFWLVMAEILLIGMIAARGALFRKNDRTMWQLFFLGAAFMLLELHAISRLSLTFGSTWFTSAIVINGILILIMVANLVVMAFPHFLRTRQGMIYLLLFASIAASYFLPASGSSGQAAHQVLVTLVTLLPMGLAGILFACIFAGVAQPNRAMALNLLGAVVGGVLEYLSNYTGIRGVELVAAALYLASFICSIWPSAASQPEPLAET
ncbi:MAG TPA: hypothetical protein V6D08_17315 [Candidatus Obscuribacterales bacterium]